MFTEHEESMQHGAAQKVLSNAKASVAQDSWAGNGGWDDLQYKRAERPADIGASGKMRIKDWRIAEDKSVGCLR